MFTLIIDTREPKDTEDLMRSFDNYPPFKDIDRSILTIKTQQIESGDFQIYHDDKLLAILERKTLEDYAASINDGRSHNVNNLLLERESEGAQLYYIIEGHAFEPHDKLFCKHSKTPITYSTIEQSIMGLMIRHNIMILRSQCLRDTCRTILCLMMKYINVAAEQTDIEESRVNTSLIDEVGKQAIKMILILGKIKFSQAMELLQNTSIHDLLNGKINMTGTIDSLPSTFTNKVNRGLTIYEQRLMLSRFKSISDSRAKKIITPDLPLKDFAEYNAPSLYEYAKKNNLKLSVKKIKDIHDTLVYKLPSNQNESSTSSSDNMSV